MAGVTRTSPATYELDVNFLGKALAHLNVDFIVDISTKLGPTSAVAAAMDAIQGAGFNIVLIGPSHGTPADSEITICVEGNYGTDTYDGTNAEALAVHLEDVVQALGTVDSVDLGSATVTAKTYVLP